MTPRVFHIIPTCPECKKQLALYEARNHCKRSKVAFLTPFSTLSGILTPYRKATRGQAVYQYSYNTVHVIVEYLSQGPISILKSFTKKAKKVLFFGPNGPFWRPHSVQRYLMLKVDMCSFLIMCICLSAITNAEPDIYLVELEALSLLFSPLCTIDISRGLVYGAIQHSARPHVINIFFQIVQQLKYERCTST